MTPLPATTDQEALRPFCLDAIQTLLAVMAEQRGVPNIDPLCAALYNQIKRIRLTEQERLAALVCATLEIHRLRTANHQPSPTPCQDHPAPSPSNQS